MASTVTGGETMMSRKSNRPQQTNPQRRTTAIRPTTPSSPRHSRSMAVKPRPPSPSVGLRPGWRMRRPRFAASRECFAGSGTRLLAAVFRRATRRVVCCRRSPSNLLRLRLPTRLPALHGRLWRERELPIGPRFEMFRSAFKPMFRLEWPPMVIQINGSNGSQARAASAAI
jgi:hypothetical protein